MKNTIEQSSKVKARKSKSRITFNHKDQMDFYPEVKRRVNQYFKDNNIEKTANWKMIGKTIFILTGLITTYVMLISNWFVATPWVMLIIAMLCGFFTAMVGLSITHDAIHGAYAKSKRANRWIGSLFNVVGANDYVWSVIHNVIHHTYTNVPDHDADLDQVPILRMKETQDLWAIHKYQYIYAFFLYPLASLSWVFLKDYRKFFAKKIGGYDNSKYPKKEMYRLFGFKAIYYLWAIIIPFSVIALPWYYILFGFIMMHLVEGTTLGVVFQLAHAIEETDFPVPDEKGKLEHSFAIHQMNTTANFAPNNFFVNFVFGGLNYQIEHHLFSNICHIHYQDIAPIVKQTAHEYGVPYHENTSFYTATLSHIETLKRMGRPPETNLN